MDSEQLLKFTNDLVTVLLDSGSRSAIARLFVSRGMDVSPAAISAEFDRAFKLLKPENEHLLSEVNRERFDTRSTLPYLEALKGLAQERIQDLTDDQVAVYLSYLLHDRQWWMSSNNAIGRFVTEVCGQRFSMVVVQNQTGSSDIALMARQDQEAAMENIDFLTTVIS
jgi:hypothetical protein